MSDRATPDDVGDLADEIEATDWKIDDWNLTTGRDDNGTLEVTFKWEPPRVGGDFDPSDFDTPEETRQQLLLDIVARIEDQSDVRGAAVDKVLETAGDEGVDSAAAEEAVETLRTRGEVYEPMDGFLRVV